MAKGTAMADGTAAAVYRRLRCDEIQVDAGWNSREEFDAGFLNGLGKSIATLGQAVPIAVNKTADGYHLIYGEQRLRSSRSEGVTKIDCLIFMDLSEQQAAHLRFAENHKRRGLNVIEQARDYFKMEAAGFSVRQIADEAGVSDDTVRRRIKLLSLPETVQRMMTREDNPLPVHQAYLLTDLSDENALSVARKAAPLCGPVASEDAVRQMVDEVIHGPTLLEMEKTTLPPGKGRGKVLSNIRHDPDDDDGGQAGIPMDDGGWPAIKEDLPVSKVNDKDELVPYESYKMPLLKGAGFAVEVMYARGTYGFSSGYFVNTPMVGVMTEAVFDLAEEYAFESAAEAVAAGLQQCQEVLDAAIEEAMNKTWKDKLRDAINKIGAQIAVLSGETSPFDVTESGTSTAEPVGPPAGGLSEKDRKKNITLAKKTKAAECMIHFSGTLEVSRADGLLYLKSGLGQVRLKVSGANCEFVIETAVVDFGGAENTAKVVKLLSGK